MAADLESRDSSHFLLTRMHVYCKPPPRGPQPATYGDLQTLANLVDEWSSTMLVGPQRGQNTDMSCGHVQLNFQSEVFSCFVLTQELVPIRCPL